MSPVETLRAAKALIADPVNWTQSRFACDQYGNTAGVLEADAVCFCAVGAIGRVEQRIPYCGSEAERILQTTAYELFKSSVEDINDNNGHGDVMRIYDRAIEIAEAAE